MRILRKLSFFLASIFLSACSTLPRMPQDVLDTAAVVQHIKCEFREAALSDPALYPFLADWNSVFTLTLETDEKGGVSANTSMTHPIMPAIFTLPLTGELSQEVRRTEKIQFAEAVPVTIKDVKPSLCPEHNRRAPLEGKLGFADLFTRAYLSTVNASIESNQLDYTLDFTIVRNATAAPKWTLIPLVKNDVMEAGFKWTGNREHSHTLQVTMKPADKKEGCTLFPEFYKIYKKCPTVYATMDDVRKANPDLAEQEDKLQNKRVERQKMLSLDGKPRVVRPTTRKGVTEDERRDLELGRAGSLLDDVDRRVRRLDRLPQ